jgi:5-methylcytosine-specific restriction endonuclease McrA
MVSHRYSEIVLKRDDYTCADCGNRVENISNGNIVAHHLDYTSDEPENLITLCASCHRKRHMPRNKDRVHSNPALHLKTITVKDETHLRLRNAGISGESMDVIINRALDARHW